MSQTQRYGLSTAAAPLERSYGVVTVYQHFEKKSLKQLYVIAASN